MKWRRQSHAILFACQAAGRLPLGRRRCGLRKSLQAVGAAATSPNFGCAAPSGSPSTMALDAWFECARLSLNFASIGNAPCPKRSGGSMEPTLSRGLSSRATHRRTWLVSHAQTACIDASVKAAQRNFDRAFAFGLNPPPLREDISVTARARFAPRTGFYARSLDALALSVDDSISSSMEHHAVRYVYLHACNMPATVVTPNSTACITRVSAHTRTRMTFLELSCTRTYVLSL